MQLKEYIDNNVKDILEFCYKCKISPSAIYRYACKKRTPRLHTAFKIQEATEGLVTIEELRGKYGETRKRKRKADNS